MWCVASWTRNSKSDGVGIEAGSDEWWAGIQVRNTAVLVVSLAIRLAGEDWRELQCDGWNHFPVSVNLGDEPLNSA